MQAVQRGEQTKISTVPGEVEARETIENTTNQGAASILDFSQHVPAAEHPSRKQRPHMGKLIHSPPKPKNWAENQQRFEQLVTYQQKAVQKKAESPFGVFDSTLMNAVEPMPDKTRYIQVDPIRNAWIHEYWRTVNQNRVESWATEGEPSKQKVRQMGAPEQPERRIDKFLEKLENAKGNMADFTTAMFHWLSQVNGKKGGRGQTPKWPDNMPIEDLLMVFETKFGCAEIDEQERQLILIFPNTEVPGYAQTVANGIGGRLTKFGFYRELINFDSHLLRAKFMVPNWPSEYPLRGWRRVREDEEVVPPLLIVRIIPLPEPAQMNQVDLSKDRIDQVCGRVRREGILFRQILELTTHLGVALEKTIAFEIISKYRMSTGLPEETVQDIMHSLVILEVAMHRFPKVLVVSVNAGKTSIAMLKELFIKLALRERSFSAGFVMAFWGIEKPLLKTNQMTQEDRVIQKWYQRSPELSALELQVHEGDVEMTFAEFVQKFVLSESIGHGTKENILKLEKREDSFEELFSSKIPKFTTEIDDSRWFNNSTTISSSKSKGERVSVYLDSDCDENDPPVSKRPSDETDSFASVDSGEEEKSKVFGEAKLVQDRVLKEKEDHESMKREIAKCFGKPQIQSCKYPETEFKVLTVGLFVKPFSMLLKNPAVLYMVRTIHCEKVDCGFARDEPWKPTVFGAKEIDELGDKKVVVINPSESAFQIVSDLVAEHSPKVVELGPSIKWEDEVVWKLRTVHTQTRFLKKPVFGGSQSGTKMLAEHMYREGALYDRTLGQVFVSKEVRELTCKILRLNRPHRARILEYLTKTVALEHPRLGRGGDEEEWC